MDCATNPTRPQAIMQRKIEQPRLSLLRDDADASKVIKALALLVGEAVPLGLPAGRSAPGLGRGGGGGARPRINNNSNGNERPGDWTCKACSATVSYTHLTLPTIYSV